MNRVVFSRIVEIPVLMRRGAESCTSWRTTDELCKVGRHPWLGAGHTSALLLLSHLCGEGRRAQDKTLKSVRTLTVSFGAFADGWNKGIRRKHKIGLFWKTSRRFCALDFTGGVFDTLHLSDRVLCMLLWLLLCLCISDSVLNDTLTDCKTRCRHLLVFYIFKTMSFM